MYRYFRPATPGRRAAALIRLAPFGLALALLLVAGRNPARAAGPITVADGAVAVLEDGQCSLMEALENAESLEFGQPNVDCAPGDVDPAVVETIVLPALGSFTLTQPHHAFPTVGLLSIGGRLIIQGNGATLARDPAAADFFRLLQVSPGGELTLDRLTLRGGRAGSGFGGAVLAEDAALTVRQSLLTGNSAAQGGAVYVSGGSLTLDRSALSSNTAAADGGGLHTTGATVALSNSTLSGNTAARGGGLALGGGSATLTNVTLSANTAGQRGGGLFVAGGSLTLVHTLLAGNSAPNGREADNQATTTADAYNLFGFSGDAGLEGFSAGSSDVVPTVPLAEVLNPTLADNSGPTPTHVLLFGSPALDRAPSAACSAAPVGGVDQRGEPRNRNGVGGGGTNECDIGAVELDVPEVNLSVNKTSFGEDGGLATVTASLTAITGLTGQNVVVTYTLSGDATPGSDYTTSVGSFTIRTATHGESSGRVNLRGVDDQLVEGRESIVMTISSVTFAGGGATNIRIGVNQINTAVSDNDGRVIIEKQTSPDGAAASFGFSGGLGNFNLSDDGQRNVVVAAPAVLYVKENPTAGWFLSAVECADSVTSNSKSNLNRNMAVVNIDAGETVTCIFRNGRLPDPNGVIQVDAGEVNRAADGRCSLVEALENASDARMGRPNADCAAGYTDPAATDRLRLPAGSEFVLDRVYGVAAAESTGLPPVMGRVVIEGNGATIRRASAAPAFRLFTVLGDGDLTLDGLTLRNGRADGGDGGGVYAAGRALTLRNCVLSGHSAGFGGGAVFHAHGTLTIEDCLIDGNSATQGGGLLTVNGRAVISRADFRANSANRGGAISGSFVEASLTETTLSDGAATDGAGAFIAYADLSLDRATVRDNAATGDGGGLLSRFSVNAVRDSAVSGNTAARGAGLAGLYGTTTVNGSAFSGNAATGDGGGLIHNGGAGQVFNSTFSGNAAAFGAGLYLGSGELTMSNVTLTGNTAANRGGGAFNDFFGRLVMARNLIAGNAAPNGREVFNDGGQTQTSAGGNVFGRQGDAGLAGFGPGPADVVPAESLGDILNPTLADNGGPTPSHALVEGSPAVDRAANGACAAAPINGVDQRDQPRNLDGDGAASANECDSGAFELALSAPAAPSELSATAVSATRIDLNWRDNSGNETGFRVERSAAGADDWSAVGSTGANATSFSDTDVSCGRSYDYRVIAVRATTGQESAASDAATATTDACLDPPDAPSNPSPADGASSVSRATGLAWNGGDPNPGDTVVYDLYFGTANPPGLLAAGLATAAYNPGSLAASTTYFWRVVARDGGGLETSGPLWRFTTENVVSAPVGLYLSPKGVTTFGGATYAPGDVLAWRRDETWSLIYDADQSGGVTRNVVALARLSDGRLLLVFGSNQTVPGAGTFTPWDVAVYDPATGGYGWYLDGSDVGLTTTAEKIDALALAPDGRLLISAAGAAAVKTPAGATLKPQDEDLIRFDGTLGATSTGGWVLVFDGSVVSGLKAENVVGAAVEPVSGDYFISAANAYTIAGINGGAKDVLRLHRLSGGGYSVARVWVAGEHGYPGTFDAIEVGEGW